MNFLNGIFVKVKKEITLGTLLGILVPIGISILLWAFSVSGTLRLNSEKIIKAEKHIERIEDTVEDKTSQIEKNMQNNYEKLDEKIDKILHHLLKP